MDSSIRQDRLKDLIKALNSNGVRFAEEVGFNKQYVSHIKNKIRPLTERSIDKIIKRYPNVNKEWLMFGKGEMFLSPVDEVPDFFSEPGESYGSDPLGVFRREWVEMKARVSALEKRVEELRALVEKKKD